VTQQARQFVWQGEERELPLRFLLHDHDRKFTPFIDAVFASDEMNIIRTPYRAPDGNAYAERWLCAVREACLDKRLMLNEAHLQRIRRDYGDYYHTTRPHPGIDQQFPVPKPCSDKAGVIRRRNVVGGILHDYYRDAA
jgi:hypothetical protein